jgi:hypothetical protein
MAGTSTNFSPTKIRAGSIGHLWAGLAIPAAGARVTLHTDGTPDATANPSAKHLGLTRAGATARIVPAFDNYMADEFSAPVKTSMSGLEAVIEAELLQVFDTDVMTVLSAGFGTYATASGYVEYSLGVGTQAYTSLALIFPTEADPTKFAICHLYKCFNEAGIDSIGGARKDMSGLKVRFRGLDITSRAVTDTLGKIWWQIA